MRILYDSKLNKHKTPFGCIRTDEKCTVSVHIPQDVCTKKCFLCIENYEGFYMKMPMIKTDTRDLYEYFSVEFSLDYVGLYHYWFVIEKEDTSFRLFKEGYSDTNIEAGDKWQLTVFDKDYNTPEDFRGKVYYQIFPDRFYYDGIIEPCGKLTPYRIHSSSEEEPDFLPNEEGKILNCDFFGGNLKGIQKKLPYLKELGVGVIYLNPIFMAYSNHRYDTADYKRVDPLLGEEKDFSSLCTAAHQMGIKIIIDCAFSHTGSNSVYFDKENIFGNGAYHNPESPYRNWFQFVNYPHQYTSWWGIDTLPCTEELNEDFLNYIVRDEDSVVAHWLRLGADGIRLDVADELPDEFIMEVKKKLKEINPDALLMGEVWEDASNKESYGKIRKYLSHSELDSVMNYPFQNAIIDFCLGNIDSKTLAQTVMTIRENYPKPVYDCLMTSLSTHDTVRIINRLSPDIPELSREGRAHYVIDGDSLKKGIELEKIAAFLQFTLGGCASIYYGDEAGLQGFEDPFNRRFFPWDNINSELFEFYKNLSLVKNSSVLLKSGEINAYEDEGVFLFERFCDKERIKAVVNPLDKEYCAQTKKVLFSYNASSDGDVIKVGKNGFALFYIS